MFSRLSEPGMTPSPFLDKMYSIRTWKAKFYLGFLDSRAFHTQSSALAFLALLPTLPQFPCMEQPRLPSSTVTPRPSPTATAAQPSGLECTAPQTQGSPHGFCKWVKAIWTRNSESQVPRARSKRRGRCVHLAPCGDTETEGPERGPVKPRQWTLLPTLETTCTNKTFSG